MKTIMLMASKEIREGMRNRWVLAATTLLAALALTLTFLGSAPTGSVGAGALDVVVISLASLTIFIVPLISLLISHDAIVGEIERGTMTLLLSYPVRRWQVLFGKFLGHLAILTFATFVGYGLAALALATTGKVTGSGSWTAFATMTVSSVLLGAVFVSIGYLISALVRDRGTAGGIAIGIWLLFVVLYDMALLGVLVADKGRFVTAGVLDALLLLNPTDAYRILNLSGSADIAAASGMAGMLGNAALEPAILTATLAAWVAAPMALATLAFSRRTL
ncbi:ABC transporter permease subunit [Mesorhizobium sp. A623]